MSFQTRKPATLVLLLLACIPLANANGHIPSRTETMGNPGPFMTVPDAVIVISWEPDALIVVTGPQRSEWMCGESNLSDPLTGIDYTLWCDRTDGQWSCINPSVRVEPGPARDPKALGDVTGTSACQLVIATCASLSTYWMPWDPPTYPPPPPPRPPSCYDVEYREGLSPWTCRVQAPYASRGHVTCGILM